MTILLSYLGKFDEFNYWRTGFIGSNFVQDWLSRNGEPVINLDKLTYAGNMNNLATVRQDPRHIFVLRDVNDDERVAAPLPKYRSHAAVHFAAESHVDRSILGPAAFVKTNINGPFDLLEATRTYWRVLPDAEKAAFRFQHAPTDEVYGALEATDAPFSEATQYLPNGPYSALKAASHHLLRSCHDTYSLLTLTNNCSNYCDAYHFKEKLIPLMILYACAGKSFSIHGDGH